MPQSLPLSAVKAHLSELVDRVASEQERVVLTRNGRPAAVLVSPDDLESLEETLTILSEPELMERVKRGLEDAERGDVFSVEEVRAALETHRRRSR